MSIFRRMLIISKLIAMPAVTSFSNGIITLNFEGNGAKTNKIGTEVILNA